MPISGQARGQASLPCAGRRRRPLAAKLLLLSVLALPLSAAITGALSCPHDRYQARIAFLPALVCLSLGAMVFLVLRKTSLFAAAASTAGLAVLALGLLYLNLQGYLAASAPWLVAALAVVIVFGVGRHILHMAVQALRRGILNQHANIAMIRVIIPGAMRDHNVCLPFPDQPGDDLAVFKALYM